MDNYRAIENLIYSYATLLDSGDLENMAKLFSQASIAAQGSASITGFEATLSAYRRSTRLYENGTPMTRHLTTNVCIDVDEQLGSAKAQSYFTVMQATDKLPLQAILSGRYEDEFEQCGDKWEFRNRIIYIDLVGNLAEHMLPTADLG